MELPVPTEAEGPGALSEAQVMKGSLAVARCGPHAEFPRNQRLWHILSCHEVS